MANDQRLQSKGAGYFFLQFYDPCPAFIERTLYIQSYIFQTSPSFEHLKDQSPHSPPSFVRCRGRRILHVYWLQHYIKEEKQTVIFKNSGHEPTEWVITISKGSRIALLVRSVSTGLLQCRQDRALSQVKSFCVRRSVQRNQNVNRLPFFFFLI